MSEDQSRSVHIVQVPQWTIPRGDGNNYAPPKNGEEVTFAPYLDIFNWFLDLFEAHDWFCSKFGIKTGKNKDFTESGQGKKWGFLAKISTVDVASFELLVASWTNKQLVASYCGQNK